MNAFCMYVSRSAVIVMVTLRVRVDLWPTDMPSRLISHRERERERERKDDIRSPSSDRSVLNCMKKTKREREREEGGREEGMEITPDQRHPSSVRQVRPCKVGASFQLASNFQYFSTIDHWFPSSFVTPARHIQ